MRSLSGLSRVAGLISAAGLWLAAGALLAIVVLNAVNIVLRFVFFAALPWAEEAMLYLMIFGVYVGAITAAWQQAHIRIDALVNLGPPRLRRSLSMVSTLLLAAILIPVVLASYRVVSLLFELDQRSDALQLPMWIAQGVIPAALMLIILMSVLAALVQTADESEPMRDTALQDRV
jgi:TRAP-type C4-dicarboxylate transport system permease small subunit